MITYIGIFEIIIMIILFLLTSYFIGSILTADIVSYCMKDNNIRKSGSGNPGATNMLRIHGKIAGSLTLIGDMFKVWVCIYIIKLLGATDDIIPFVQPLSLLVIYFCIQNGQRGKRSCNIFCRTLCL